MNYYRLIRIIYILLPYSTSFVLPLHRGHLVGEAHATVFPDDSQEQSSYFTPKVRRRPCSGPTNFCEDVVGYPRGYVEVILKKKAMLYESMFAMEDFVNDEELRTIDNDDGFICATKREWKFPKIGMNARNQWKYIYNNYKHRQAIRLEYCQRPGSQCILNPQGTFRTECKQKYIPYRMLTIGYDGNLESDTFLQPVACCCSIKPLIVWNGS